MPIKPAVKPLSPETDFPASGKPAPENHPLVNTSIKNNNYKDQQQRSIGNLTSIVDQGNHEKAVVVDPASQLNSIENIMAYAKGKGFEIFEDCARDFLIAAGSIERAKKAVEYAAVAAAAKLRRRESIHNPAGLLFKALGFNEGAKLDPESLDSERKKRLAEKEKKYEGIYIT